jgi:hypothetical protein
MIALEATLAFCEGKREYPDYPACCNFAETVPDFGAVG